MAATRALQAAEEQRVEGNHLSLLEQYAAYVALRGALAKVAKQKKVSEEKIQEMRQKLSQDGAAIHEVLRQHQLEEPQPVIGELRAGSALTDAGAYESSSLESSESSAAGLAHVQWETAHFGALDKERGWDMSLRGRFGLQPTYTLLQDAATKDQSLAAYQEALVIDAGTQASGFLDNMEFSVLAKGGFIRIGQPSEIVSRDGANTLAIPIGSGDRVSHFLELSGGFSLFDKPMIMKHLTKDTLSPRLAVAGGIRSDSRLRRTGQIEDVGKSDLAYVISVMLEGLQIRDRRTRPEDDTMFSATFGVEYLHFRDPKLPYGFQLVIRGDLDLLKAIKGGHVDPPGTTGVATR